MLLTATIYYFVQTAKWKDDLYFYISNKGAYCYYLLKILLIYYYEIIGLTTANQFQTTRLTLLVNGSRIYLSLCISRSTDFLFHGS